MASSRESLYGEIRARLEPLGTEERAVNEKRYLKSDLEFLGVKVPLVRKEAKAWLRERGEISAEEIVSISEELWAAGVHELRSFAVDLSIFRVADWSVDDLPRFETWLREAKTWAHVDAIAVHLVGRLLEREPAVTKTLDRWARDEDFWLRRSAMLALLLGLRVGEGDWKRFVRYADTMLEETEFFIRKAIGWILRETSKKRPERVERYVAERLDRLSGLTLREAIRHLDPAVQEDLRERFKRA